MTKKELLTDPNSVFNKAADNETLFVPRGQDISAPEFVRGWAFKFLLNSLDFRSIGYRDISPMVLAVSPDVMRKFQGALADAAAMEAQPGRKIPD